MDKFAHNPVDKSVDRIGKMNNGGENNKVMPPHVVRSRLKGHPSERSEVKGSTDF